MEVASYLVVMNSWWVFAVATGAAAGGAILFWLMTVSTGGYPPEDLEAHASSFGDVVKEGHAPLVALLWVLFLLAVGFVVWYWVMYWPPSFTFYTTN